MTDTMVEIPDTDTRDTEPRRQPPYAVIIENDDSHTINYVIELIGKVFHYPIEKCILLTKQVHEEGRSVVWSGSKEVAELKRDQVRSGGVDFYAEKPVTAPLGCYIEELP